MGHIRFVGFNGMKVGHETQTVGPRHDPYQNDIWHAVVDRDGHTYEASWKFASLGLDHLELVVDDKVVRTEKFFCSEDAALVRLKWSLLFKRHVGITIDQCREAYERFWEPDPMGEPSMYE